MMSDASYWSRYVLKRAGGGLERVTREIRFFDGVRRQVAAMAATWRAWDAIMSHEDVPESEDQILERFLFDKLGETALGEGFDQFVGYYLHACDRCGFDVLELSQASAE